MISKDSWVALATCSAESPIASIFLAISRAFWFIPFSIPFSIPSFIPISLAGTSALILKYPDGQCWILITNTSTWKGHGFSNDTMAFFEKLRKKYMPQMPKRDLFL
jgi:uncharacterized membrane protein